MSGEIDMDVIETIKGLMEDGYAALVDVYLKENAGHLSNIREGVRGENAESVWKAAHSLKSASGNMGLKALSRAAEDVEMRGQRIAESGGRVEVLSALVDDMDVLFQRGGEVLKAQV